MESPETALGQHEAALDVCGDGMCNRGEPSTCPEDCTYGTWCGDGYCGCTWDCPRSLLSWPLGLDRDLTSDL